MADVEVERRAAPRYVPNDPALSAPEPGAVDPAAGTTIQWWAARSNFPQAWDVARGDGARVAIIDTGVESTHPDLVDRVALAQSFDAIGRVATTDEIGHGTHVASLACAASDNGVGLAGAGLGCKVLAIRSDFTDSSVAASIVWAADHGAHAINMSFGTDPGTVASRAVLNAIDYAVARRVVLVAAAADEAVEDQGYPANVLQPTGSGPVLEQGRGLTVTAADFADARAPFAGRGSQISLAAYGAYSTREGPRGIFGAFTAQVNALETGDFGATPRPPCRCRALLGEDNRYAYLQGTSMAAPMVAATAALMRRLNPDLDATDVAQTIKATARRSPDSVWNAELGWGILDAGAAMLAARTLDRRAPASKIRSAPTRTRRSVITLRWRGSDDAPRGVVASGVRRYELWRALNGRRAQPLAETKATTKRVRLRRGGRYAFYTVAIDAAGNRERTPLRPDVRISVPAR